MERFTAFNPRIQNLLHFWAAGVGDNTAVAQRSRSPLHTPLKPPHHFTRSNLLGRPPAQFLLIIYVFDKAACRGYLCTFNV